MCAAAAAAVCLLLLPPTAATIAAFVSSVDRVFFFAEFISLSSDLIISAMDRREIQRKKFYNVISSEGRFFFTSRKLKHYIKRVITAKDVERKKSPADYALLNRYDVARIGEGKEILIKKNSSDPYIRYISESEMFDVIYDAHVTVCHGGQKRTYCEVKKTVANVTREQIAIFLSYCITCEEKRATKKNKRVVKPLTSNGYSERGQVDLIDMRSCKTIDNYCFILHYQDHFTKFSILKALRSKQTSEVSHHLYDIFTLIGAPRILQSDNGNEFIGSPLTTMMHTFWPETQLIRGSPRHPQSQGSVEKANGDVKTMLCGLMREKNTSNWVDLLKQVQWTKNTVHHRVIGTSPYEAMFGQKHASPMKITEQVRIYILCEIQFDIVQHFDCFTQVTLVIFFRRLFGKGLKNNSSRVTNRFGFLYIVPYE